MILTLLTFPFLVGSYSMAGAATGARSTPSLAFTVEKLADSPWQLKFIPPKDHHFNLGAPAKVAVKSPSGERVASLQKSLKEVTARFEGGPAANSCQVDARLFVCNDANTYCRPVEQVFDCRTLATREVGQF